MVLITVVTGAFVNQQTSLGGPHIVPIVIKSKLMGFVFALFGLDMVNYGIPI